MKKILFSLILVCLISCKEHTISSKVVEASCGQCQFNMDGSGCDLAIKIGNESYYVKGTNIDDHGDAHASDGFCEAIKKAKVTGEIIDGYFISESFEVLD